VHCIDLYHFEKAFQRYIVNNYYVPKATLKTKYNNVIELRDIIREDVKKKKKIAT